MRRPRKALEIFLSVGVGAGMLGIAFQPCQALAQHSQHGPESLSSSQATIAEGGEGGEGGRADSAQTDLDLLVVLAQMQGHLLVAQELLNQQHTSAAEPHVGHPIDELYGALEPALQSRQIPPFLGTLEDLRQQVRLNPQAPATGLKLARAQQAIAAATQSLPGGKPSDTQTVTAVVRQLAETAIAEYAAAVAGDRVVEAIEYQDARGFLLEAQRLLDQAAANKPAAAAELSGKPRTIATMLQAFPTVMPPRKAAMEVTQLQQLQKQL
ncbi:MAG: hypothetical protein VKK63_03170 [Synechococcus sp.]|nr:hypothetical protein [Synechococcus sp.]